MNYSSICPGRFLALSSTYAAIAGILAAFDLSKAVDVNGVIIEPKLEFINNSQKYVFYSFEASSSSFNCDLSRPVPFECRITPRSKVYEKLIMEAAEHEFH